MDKVKPVENHKKCMRCGRKYPIDEANKQCSCGGWLYTGGIYRQRRTGGGTDGKA